MRRKIAVAAGIVVSGLFLWLAFRDTNLDLISGSLASARMSFVAPFLLSLLTFYWFKSIRWRHLLSPTSDVRSGDLFPIVMIGYAGTAVLPMQMGEFVRAYIASRRYSFPYSLVLGSIAMERIFDLLTILTLLGIVLATGQSTPQILINAGYLIASLTMVGLAFSYLLVTNTGKVLAVFRSVFTRSSPRFTDLIGRQLEAAAQGFESITQPRLLLRIATNSVLQWSLMGLCIWCSLAALDVEVPVAGVVLVLVATIVGISLPTSPGYVGNIQLAYVVALQPFGVSPEDAIAASIFYHLLAYLSVVIVGFTFLHRMGYGMIEIQAQARASSSEP